MRDSEENGDRLRAELWTVIIQAALRRAPKECFEIVDESVTEWLAYWAGAFQTEGSQRGTESPLLAVLKRF